MFEAVLLHEPPRPNEKQAEPRQIVIPPELQHFEQIDFGSAEDQDVLFSSFVSIIKAIKTEQNEKLIMLLAKYVLENIEESMFEVFAESKLAECIFSVIARFPERDFDHLATCFIRNNITIFIQNLEHPVLKMLQERIIAGRLEVAVGLLKAIYASQRLTAWVNQHDRNGYILTPIFEELWGVKKLEALPPLLTTEIARCLIISALLLNTLQDKMNLKEVVITLNKTILRYLKYVPEAFINPSTVYCLQQVATEKIIAVPLADARAHYASVRLDSVLQLVRFAIFARTVRDKKKLLEIATICPAAAAEVLRANVNKFCDNPQAMSFLTRSLSVESVTPYAKFTELPEDLLGLAIFLHSNSQTQEEIEMRLKAKTKYVGRILGLVDENICENIRGSTNASVLIGAAKIISHFLTAPELKHFPQTHREKMWPVAPHFFAVACRIADAIIASPLYPHESSDSPISFMVKEALDDMAVALLGKANETLTYLLNTKPKPGRVMLLAVIFEKMLLDAVTQRTWTKYIRMNLPSIIKYGLSILMVPTEITSAIAARFYIALIKTLIPRDPTFPEALYSAHIITAFTAPIELTENVSTTAGALEQFSEEKTLLRYFAFIERITENAYIKSYIILNARCRFWDSLFFWTNPEVMKQAPRTTARVFRIFRNLSDYSNSIYTQALGGQRIIYDTLHNSIMSVIMDRIMYISGSSVPSGLGTSDLLISVLELILAWCEPLPLSALLRKRVDKGVIDALAAMTEGTNPYFAKIGRDLHDLICKCLSESEEGDPNELEEAQGIFQADPNAAERLSGLFFTLLK